MIYGYRSGICVINVSKFMHMFRIGLFLISGVLARNKPIWFVTKEVALGRYLRFFANKCGEFSSTFFWVRGMLSNYKLLSTVAAAYFTMPELIKNRKSFLFGTNFDFWLFTRYTWPGLVFVSSVFSNYFVINEALVSQIPTMGICDTNAAPQGCTIAVPGNDDSVACIVFYSDLLAEFILYKKFLSLFIWFVNTRRSRRLLSFYE